MPWNPFSKNNNQINSGYAPSSQRPKNKIVLMVLVYGGIICIVIAVFVLRSLSLKHQQDQVTSAARKHIPNAQVSDIKVAGGFAIATVGNPAAQGQANAGNMTIFKVNKDGSMTQIANGSSFSPIDLLGLGIPLATQAKLLGQNLAQVQQALAATCNYSGGPTPGYSGFDGSFNPSGWQIDAGTLDSLEKVLTAAIGDKNNTAKPDEKIICVNATRKNSNLTTDKQTYISTSTLELQFISENGTLSNHQFTFAIGPNYYRSYTLDGQKI